MLDLAVQAGEIRSRVFQLIAQNPQTHGSPSFCSPTAGALLGQGDQFLGRRATIMGCGLRAVDLQERFDPGFGQSMGYSEKL